jgi:hypothetical protein
MAHHASFGHEGRNMKANDLQVLDQILIERRAAMAPDMSEDDFFEFFAAQQVLRDFRLSPDEVHSGIIGRPEKEGDTGTDGGIDGFYLLVNGKLIRESDDATDLRHLKSNIVVDIVLIQATRTPKFELKRVVRMKETADDIFSTERKAENHSERSTDSKRVKRMAFSQPRTAVRISDSEPT